MRSSSPSRPSRAPIADAPVSAEEIRRFDAELPAVVDAWVARRQGLAVQPAGRTTSYRG